jgi:hypothetical protein
LGDPAGGTRPHRPPGDYQPRVNRSHHGKSAVKRMVLMTVSTQIWWASEGRRAATTLRSDFGADRTACDATRAVPIRLRTSVGQNTKPFLARMIGNAWPSGGKRRPNQACAGGVGHQDPLRNQIVSGRISGLAGIPRSPWLSWGELSLGAYPSGVQMGNTGLRRFTTSPDAWLSFSR